MKQSLAGADPVGAGSRARTTDDAAGLPGVGALVQALQREKLRTCFLEGPRPLSPARARFCGRARTLATLPVREDVLAEVRSRPKPEDPHRIAIDGVSAGEVLVIDARGNLHAGVVGDLLAERVAAQGGAAIVTDGCVRDTPGFAEIEMPVFSAGRHGGTFANQHLGIAVNVPVACGGALIRPGDYLIGDMDGVVVVPAGMFERIVDAAREQERLDEFLRGKIRGGVPLADAYPPNAELRREYEQYAGSRPADA